MDVTRNMVFSYPILGLGLFVGDPEGSLHAASSVLIEFLCYCIETPAFLDIKVTNGRQFGFFFFSIFVVWIACSHS